MSAFDDLEELFSLNLSADELLERWTNDTDFITNPINDPLATWNELTFEEMQATSGAIDPTRLAYQPLQPLAVPSTSPVCSEQPLPVPHVPVISDHTNGQESLFLTPPGSPATIAGAQEQSMGSVQTYVSSYPEFPSLTEGAWPPFVYTQTEAIPTFMNDIPIDPALLAADDSPSSHPQFNSLPNSLNPAPFSYPTPTPNTSITQSQKRKRPITPSPPTADDHAPPCKRPKRTPRSLKPLAPPPPLPSSLPAPLSILTATSTVPLKDIPTFVSRSPSIRRAEVACKTPSQASKIPRPMNSFILYRYAYAERIAEYAASVGAGGVTIKKKGCKGANHQNISKLAGESWRLETGEVRELFEGFARVEKEGHGRTWVGYRYVPGRRGGV